MRRPGHSLRGVKIVNSANTYNLRRYVPSRYSGIESRKIVSNFISVVGNKRLDQITRTDAANFRDWWNARIDEESLSPNSAMNDLTIVGHTSPKARPAFPFA